jgi:hypothetical protein
VTSSGQNSDIAATNGTRVSGMMERCGNECNCQDIRSQTPQMLATHDGIENAGHI